MREVCRFCQFPTPDPEVCQRCRRSLINKETSDTEKEDITSLEVFNHILFNFYFMVYFSFHILNNFDNFSLFLKKNIKM